VEEKPHTAGWPSNNANADPVQQRKFVPSHAELYEIVLSFNCDTKRLAQGEFAMLDGKLEKLFHDRFADSCSGRPWISFEIPEGRSFNLYTKNKLVAVIPTSSNSDWLQRTMPGWVKRLAGVRQTRVIYMVGYEPANAPTHLLDPREDRRIMPKYQSR
jgi:hypothetical protein